MSSRSAYPDLPWINQCLDRGHLALNRQPLFYGMVQGSVPDKFLEISRKYHDVEGRLIYNYGRIITQQATEFNQETKQQTTVTPNSWILTRTNEKDSTSPLVPQTQTALDVTLHGNILVVPDEKVDTVLHRLSLAPRIAVLALYDDEQLEQQPPQPLPAERLFQAVNGMVLKGWRGMAIDAVVTFSTVGRPTFNYADSTGGISIGVQPAIEHAAEIPVAIDVLAEQRYSLAAA